MDEFLPNVIQQRNMELGVSNLGIERSLFQGDGEIQYTHVKLRFSVSDK